jgi:hypothetical protein
VKLSRFLKLDRLQCSPAGLIGVLVFICLAGALIAGGQHPRPKPKAVAVPATHAAAGHDAHLIAGVALVTAIMAFSFITALVVRRLRGDCGCWRPGTPVQLLRLNRATGVLEPVETPEALVPAEAVAETGSDGSPLVLTPDGVSVAGAE